MFIFNIQETSSYRIRNVSCAKKKGITLFSSIIVSGIILTLVLSFMQIILKDIQLNADFFEGERAYFAAESGIEHGLLALKSEPTQHLYDQLIELESSEARLTIDNRTSTEEFTLEPYGNKKFSLLVMKRKFQAVDITKLKAKAFLSEGGVLPQGDELFQWKLQCRNDDQTISIQGKKRLLFAPNLIRNWEGQSDMADGETKPSSIYRFWTMSGFSSTEKQTCYLSFQNLTDKNVQIVLSGTNFPPSVATITSVGHANKRQKVITFDIAQKNLSTLFDFGIFDNTD